MRSSDPVKNVQRRSLEHTLPASMTVGSKQHLLRRSISNNKQSVVFKRPPKPRRRQPRPSRPSTSGEFAEK